jgi:hypothetical protein
MKDLGPGERYPDAALGELYGDLAKRVQAPQMTPEMQAASARYNAMNRHQRRVFDANAKKMMRQKKRTVTKIAARKANKA